MDNLSSILNNIFDAPLSKSFVKQASYNEKMDFLEYVSEDAITVSDRIDGFLTVIWNQNQNKVIGFKVKGFKYVFTTIIQPLSELKLKDEDFNPIVEALEKLFTIVGDDMLSGTSTEEHRTQAYKSARELANEDDVRIPTNVNLAA